MTSLISQLPPQALLKIVKHCHDSLPSMVTGSLLGIVDTEKGILEVTHSFPFPESRDRKNDPRTAASLTAGGDDAADEAAAMDGLEFQMEMMRMLREVNVDNNCVGWYQSMYLGIYSTSALLENQWSYQADLSPNAVVVLYDPMQTAHGNLMLHCYRLSDEAIEYRKEEKNTYIDPNKIFERIPVKLTNPGLARALLADIVTDGSSSTTAASLLQSVTTGSSLTMSADTTFDRLDLSTNPYLEKHLEFLCTWVDDLAAEQQKFQYYSRQLNQGNKKDHWRNKNKSADDDDGEGWNSANAPRRMESLLVGNQIRSYCNQMDKFAGGGLGKLFLAGGLHKEKQQGAAGGGASN